MPDNSAINWQTAGRDETRSGLFPRTVRIRSRPKYFLPAQGAIRASVIFDCEQRVLVADMAGYVQAFSPDGEFLWKTRLNGGISATPVAHPAKPSLFLGTHNGMVYGLETRKGEILWKREIPTQSDPRILADLLYWRTTNVIALSSWGERFYALNADSGAELFSWNAGISPYAAAAADRKGALYCLRAVSKSGVEFISLSPQGKETLLHCAPEDRQGARRALVAAAPVVDEDRGIVFFLVNRDEGSLLHGWSLKTNTLSWSCSLPHPVQATPALWQDGSILVPSMAGIVHAFGPNGVPRFRYASDSEYFLAGGVTDSGDVFYIGDPYGFLHAIDDQGKGKKLFEAKRSIEARPSFNGRGHLYVPCTDRKVYVFSA